MTSDPASLLPVALRAADEAAEMIRNRRPAAVTEKQDRDLVSDVDVAIERQIRSLLKEVTPDIGFLGEEEGRTGGSRAGWLWTLDPIDGTSNYAHGIPLCATSLALLHDGNAVLGVIDAPFLGHRYHAVAGHGAYAGDRQLSVSTTRQMRDAVVAVGDYATGPGADVKSEVRLALTVQLAPRVHRLRMIGTAAVDLAWVAEGRLDCSITLSNKPWDTSAGVLIARESGASVVDADGSPHNMESAFTIAAPPALIDQLLLLVRQADGVRSDTNANRDGDSSPNAALDRVLTSCSVLIFEFDGPICDFSGALPADAGDRLLTLASGEGMPRAMAARAFPGTDDLYEIADAMGTFDADIARPAAVRLAEMELAAAERAIPSPYVHEALAACRDSGRITVIVSRQSNEAVEAWLARFGLSDQVHHVFAVTRHQSAPVQHLSALVDEAIHALRARTDEYAFITKRVMGVQEARRMGVHPIGYARTQADGAHLSGVGAESVVLSLADLTLRLRARPLAR
jgi:myo-inositol-1(or 4)-monophosphatase